MRKAEATRGGGCGERKKWRKRKREEEDEKEETRGAADSKRGPNTQEGWEKPCVACNHTCSFDVKQKIKEIRQMITA